jgi:acyl dehydratase
MGSLFLGVDVDGDDRPAPDAAPPPSPRRADEPITITRTIGGGAAHTYTECARIWNPIHTDRDYARAAGLPDIILHGTATLALSVSRVTSLLGKPAKRVRCRFSGMVLMPSTLTVHASQAGDAIAFETRDASGAPVIERGWVE